MIRQGKLGQVAARTDDLSFIINPNSGTGGKPVMDILSREMDKAGRGYQMFLTEYGGHAEVLAQEVAEGGCGTVVAVGGDGTLNEVARGVMGTGADLGLLPCGSGNAFARYAGIPLKLERACRVLLNSKPRVLDVGRAGDEIFMSSAGFGIDAEVCRRFNAREGGRRGTLPYVVISIDAFRSYRPERTTIEMDGGRSVVCDPYIVTVANISQYGNGAVIAPEARPDDGILDVCVIEDVTLWRGLWNTRRLFNGSIDRMAGVRMFRCKRVKVVRERPGLLQVDGEARESEDVVEVEVLPGAISVVMP